MRVRGRVYSTRSPPCPRKETRKQAEALFSEEAEEIDRVDDGRRDAGSPAGLRGPMVLLRPEEPEAEEEEDVPEVRQKRKSRVQTDTVSEIAQPERS